jgi:hypothetical protein
MSYKSILSLAAILLGSFAQADSLTPQQKDLTLRTLQSEALALTVARSVDPAQIAANPSGTGCNWSYLEAITNSAPGTAQASSRTTTYYTSDPSSISVNDVTALNNSLTTNASAYDGTDFGGTVQIQSQTMGVIKVNVSGTGIYDTNMTGTMNIEMDLVFPGFAAAFVIHEVTVPGGSVTTYSLNGDALSAAEVAFIEIPQLQPTPNKTSAASTGHRSLFLF